VRSLTRLLIVAFIVTGLCTTARGAQTSATVVGTVTDSSARPVPGALVTLSSPSSRQTTTTDERGRFTLLELPPDRYEVIVRANGMQELRIELSVLPARSTTLAVELMPLSTITTVRAARANGVRVGASTDLFTLSKSQAQAPLQATSSGLSQYAAGLAQGAASRVPGIQEDQFANAIVRGGQTNDTLYLYDGVPVAQALIAEPGGNVIGAQLPTTGVGFTDVYLGGFSGPDAALGGVINEVPAGGTFPAASTVTTTGGTPSAGSIDLSRTWATSNLRQRYAIDVRSSTTAFAYGNGNTFYPAEAATYGLALANRSAWSMAANVAIAAGSASDVQLSMLFGSSVSDQYGTPLSGPYEFTATTPSRIRGTFGVVKAAWTHRYQTASTTFSLYRSYYNALTDAPFFDDLSFPNGPISYMGTQQGLLDGARFEVRSFPSDRLELSYGADAQFERFVLQQQIPQLEDGNVSASPFSTSTVLYAADAWHLSNRVTLATALRGLVAYAHPGTVPAFQSGAIDPHASLVYDTGRDALRAMFDHVSVPPHALDLALATTPLSTERASTTELSYERRGAATARITYFNRQERNRIDLLPLAGNIEVPANVGDLNAHGFEFSYARGILNLSGTYQRTVSSSAQQFAINDLNAAALAAGHLFPVGYVPDFSAIAGLRFKAGRVVVAPALSWESGYPYGNGKRVWIFNTAGVPVSVPNDNHVNPGYNYYFLRDPALAYDATSNPYIGSLGTGEGDDPNTLRTPPQLLASLHVGVTLRENLMLAMDIANIFGTASPTQLQGNPYLIGPPGYNGGDPSYSAWYGSQMGSGSYTLGNGVPTRNGTAQALPWTYGAGAYVPSSYPQARSFLLHLDWTL
jgi:Carboxypeptidase regulatory-like domain